MTDSVRPNILIQNASLLDANRGLIDVLINDGNVTLAEPNARDTSILANHWDVIVEADGGLVIPGLSDHHVHLASYAASLNSIRCGPPEVTSAEDLCAALNQPGSGWLRGAGYHESVVPEMNRQWLDEYGPDRPIRIQHRSGRLWILNSEAMNLIQSAAADLAQHEQQRLVADDGKLYDLDELLGQLTTQSSPDIARASQNLAAFGVTSINDMTPSNDYETWRWFLELQAAGDLIQRVRLSGRPELSQLNHSGSLEVGETKVHLHDSQLPVFDDLVEVIQTSHKHLRKVAVHCVTEVELVYTLAAYREAGTLPGDRIEHASIVPPDTLEQFLELGLSVVTQPNFVAERGDAYLSDIPKREHGNLYRVASLSSAGIPVSFSTDMPFGHPDPWAAMLAATTRRTPAGVELSPDERVTADIAIRYFLGRTEDPFTSQQVAPGMQADLCLMSKPWSKLRQDLSSRHVRLTIADGRIIYHRDSGSSSSINPQARADSALTA